MSYELKIDPKSRASGRFIGKVRKAIVTAALEEKKQNKVSQQTIADILGVNRSVVNKILLGEANLTLRTIAELALALGREPVFELKKLERPLGTNRPETKPISVTVEPSKSKTMTHQSHSVVRHFSHASTAAKPVEMAD